MYIINFAEAAKVSLQVRAYKHLDKETQISNIQSAIAKIESILNESGTTSFYSEYLISMNFINIIIRYYYVVI